MLLAIPKVLSNGPISEIFLFKGAIDHGDGAGRRRVLFVECSACHYLGANNVKISRADAHPRCMVLSCSRRRRWLAFNEDALVPGVPFHGAVKRKTHLLNA